MNSVALPASASAPTLSTESDLIRHAARGETEAVAELFRRHGQMAWRLAQAVAISREAAVAAVGNGYARSLRGAKHRQPDDGSFRPLLLSAVYRSAMDDARAHAGAAPSGPVAPTQATRGTKGARNKANRDDAVLTEAAFRSLPERWRAALWLSEVEALETDRVAPILGVSAAVATQLVTRGTRGLAGRFAQARRPVPEHLGAALRPIGLAMPSNLGEVVAVRLKAVASDPGLRFAPISAWLSERAARPLQVAVGGLLGMGLIGIGLVGQGSSVRPGNVAVPPSPGGTVPQVTQPASFFPGGSASGDQSAAGALNTNFTAAASGATAAATTGSTVGTPAGGATGGTTGGTPSTTHHTPSGGTTTPPGGGTTTPPGGGTTTPPGGGTTTPPGGTTTSTKTIVSLGPVASVTQTGNATTVNVLPSTSGTAPAPVSVTLGCSTGLGLTVGKLQVGLPVPTHHQLDRRHPRHDAAPPRRPPPRACSAPCSAACNPGRPGVPPARLPCARMDLDGEWRAAVSDDDLRRLFANDGFDDAGWQPMPVPGHWRSHPGFATSDGPVLYRHRFEAARPEPGTRAFLTFDGIFYQGDVWLDGEYLGDTEGYFFPHTFEVTDALQARAEHVLAVEVACPPPTDLTAKRNLTGIFQHWDCIDPAWNPGGHLGAGRDQPDRPGADPVAQGPVPGRHLRRRHPGAGGRARHRRRRARSPSAPPPAGRSGRPPRPPTSTEEHTLAAGVNQVRWRLPVERPELWWPHALGDQPLYEVDVEVLAPGLSDRRRVLTGLRQVRVRNFVATVNGERLFLKGANCGPTRRALAETTAAELAGDVTLARAAGLDLLRVHAHITRAEFYEAADRQGMLIWQDLPLQWGYAARCGARPWPRPARP